MNKATVEAAFSLDPGRSAQGDEDGMPAKHINRDVQDAAEDGVEVQLLCERSRDLKQILSLAYAVIR